MHGDVFEQGVLFLRAFGADMFFDDGMREHVLLRVFDA
jgi:hypothetical protein